MSQTRFEALYGERLDVHREGGEVQLVCVVLFVVVDDYKQIDWIGASMRTPSEEIEKIEKQLATALEASGSLNGIADLLAVASPVAKPPQLQHKAIYALYRTYTLLFNTNKLDALRADPFEPAQAVRQWLLQKLEQFLSLLVQQLYNPEPSISVRNITLSPEGSYPFFQSASLHVSFSLLRQRSAVLSSNNENPQIHTVHFRAIVRGVLCPPPNTSVCGTTRNEFIDKFIKLYDDLRWFFFREIKYAIMVPPTFDRQSNQPSLAIYCRSGRTRPKLFWKQLYGHSSDLHRCHLVRTISTASSYLILPTRCPRLQTKARIWRTR
jgi:hypothetical protein